MNELIRVDESKCIHCGQCVKDCMQQCLSMNRNGIPELDYYHGYGGCGACQHCMAVCPTGALSWGGIDPTQLEPVRFADPDEMLGMIKGRRSVRQFKDQDIPDDLLRKIGDMLAYPPRGGNNDSLRFSLIGSKEKMREISRTTYESLGGNSPFMRMLIESKRNGRDLIFWDAPAMLIAFVDRNRATGGCETVDPIISLSYAELYANSLGLGAVWCNLATNVVSQIPQVQKLVEMPRGYEVGYVILLGIPDVKYQRVVQKEDKVTKILK